MKKKIAIVAVSLMVLAGVCGVVFNVKADPDCGPGMGNPCVPAENRECNWESQGSPYTCPDMKKMQELVTIPLVPVM